MNPRTCLVVLPLLLVLTARCEQPVLAPPSALTLRTQALVGDGKVQPGEQCDDGNAQGGDGCSSTGTLEAGFLCHVPGRACSDALLCGDDNLDSGEVCGDENPGNNLNGCTVTCDLSKCGDGAIDSLSYQSYSQEICDDGNRFDGDGCSRLCEVEPGFACAGAPSRCASSGVMLFNTGVDSSGHRLVSGPDPHWFYTGTTTGAATETRLAGDWPQELQTARFMAAAPSATTCVYQDFLIPSGINLSKFRLRLATFNDDALSAASVNGIPVTPVTIHEPAGTSWQKNIVREFGPSAPWQTGTNRIELCTECLSLSFNAFRYLFVDAFDDVCGDGAISPIEECDDGNTTSGDGCGASCDIEAGYSCYGQPSLCTTSCGDGALGEGEQCDDEDSTAGDGCGAHCTIEAGYGCTGVPSLCTVACGDGIKATPEACDDGNTSNGDGCSAACTVEAGFGCQTAPVSVFFTRRGRTDCTEVLSFATPSLSATTAQASLTTPSKYRIQYVSGAISFSANANWRPGIIGVNFTSSSGPGAFSIGIDPPVSGMPTRDQAMSLGFGLKRDFEAASGDVRLAAIDNDCSLGDNSDNTVTYRVDALPICQQVPVITFTPEPGRPDAIFAGSASPSAAIQVYVDGAPAQVCMATANTSGQWSCAAPGVAAGTHSAVATATLLGFNVPSAPVSFADTVAPAAPTITTPAQGAVVTATPGLGGMAEPDSQVTVYEDATVLCTTAATASGSWSCTPSQPLVSGPHSVIASATDIATNVSLPSAWRAFIVDVAAPAAPSLTEPLSDQTLAATTPTLRGTAKPGSIIRVYIDGGTAAACTAVAAANGSWSCAVSSVLAEGPHSLMISATDALGNTSQAATPVPFTIDTQAPDTSITRGPPALSISGDAEFEFSSNEAEVSYECGLDEESFTPCPDTYGFEPGVHTLKVRAVDAGGNADPSPAEYTWTVKLPHLAGGGCSAAPVPASWLALLALVAWRKRSARRAPSGSPADRE